MATAAGTIAVVGIVASAFLFGACEKKESPKPEPPPPAVKAPTPAKASKAIAPAAALTESTRNQVERVLTSYESIRAELARDDIAAATKSAEGLERAAQDAVSGSPERLHSNLNQVASAASRLKQVAAKDAAEVRRAFGQVSEALVALLAAEPSLQKGRYVFECPMAQGYKKWVQSTEQISNPYMGTQMAECGSPSKWQGS